MIVLKINIKKIFGHIFTAQYLNYCPANKQTKFPDKQETTHMEKL